MTKTPHTKDIHAALAFLGIDRDSYTFMGAESIACCEITVSRVKYRGRTWLAALEAVAAR